MVVDLILTVCMLSDPTTCREERLIYESRGSLAQCMMLSTPYVAQWAGEHPKWMVKSWTCNWPEDRRQGI
ncbi:hypothetical protein [Antarcticirhabdus aurantiaca]|uniref:Uncharacterized protein n=1 Tax=Antarcticirhabdus aurantiaca TaxID=2606717 RepID=A0ACD4NIX1_9HYPH|nr:hypothetical protein [Antarcticirhabdus aurantiaca]WAJ26778.1 hypothetical protein OXU80_18155 [Jeongeuplla avenae]